MNGKEFLGKVIEDIVGKDVKVIIDIIGYKENVSEIDIAKKLDINVNQVRHMLYKLQEYNIIDSIRKKDLKKEGYTWYTYYWTLNIRRIKSLALEIKKKQLDNLKHQLEMESRESFYSCPNNCIRLKLESAMEYNFRCPECDKIFVEEDNLKDLKRIGREIQKIEEDLKLIEAIKIPEIKEPVKKVVKKKPKKKAKKKPTKKVVKKKPKKKAKKKPVKKVVKKKPKKKAKKKPVKKVVSKIKKLFKRK